MRVIDYLKDALSLFRFYRLKTCFSLASVIIGIGAIVTLSCIQHGVEKNTTQMLQRISQARFNVYLGSTDKKIHNELNSLAKLKGGDWSDLTQDFNIYPLHQANPYVTCQQTQVHVPVLFLGHQFIHKMAWRLQKGRLFNELDHNQKVVILGAAAAERLEKRLLRNPLGQSISISGIYFTVIGILAHNQFDPLLDFDSNQVIYLDLPWMYRVNSHPNLDNWMIISDQTLAQTQASVRAFFKQRWGISQIFIKDTKRYYEALQSQMKLSVKTLWIVAIITLSLGFISILNLLLILLEERKGEIGLRLALGATPQNIGWQFLRETLILNWMGALIGIILGQVLSFILLKQINIAFQFSFSAMFMAFAIATLFGLVLGVIPAKLAAQKKPFELLQA